MHTLVPFDTVTILGCCQETGGILTVEEHTLRGGLGSAVAEAILDAGESVGHFGRLGLNGCFSSIVGSQKYLRTQYGLDAAAIANSVRKLLGMNG